MPDPLDLLGLKCPLVVLKIRRAMAAVAPGGALAVVADDPLALLDVPVMCHHARFTLHEARKDSDGRIHFRNFTSQPKVDVYLDHVDLIASNLENSRRSAEPRPASLEVRGDFKRQGRMVLHASLDPHARAPSFDCDFVAQGIALADWNDFLRAYAKLDAESGQLAVYAELLAQDGSFRGYVKPFLQDASVLDWNDDVVKQSLVSTAWQAFAQGVLELFKNRDTNQVATRIPVSGSAKSPHGEFWPALGNGLWNAFVEALTPQLEHGIRSR